MNTPNSGETWQKVYEEARATLRDSQTVFPSVDEAIAWANELIAKIASARTKN